MKRHRMPERTLGLYMHKLLELCAPSGAYQFQRDEYITDTEYLRAIKTLEAQGDIQCKYPAGQTFPYFIKITPKGQLYFQTRYRQKTAYVKGLITGVIIGVIPSIVTFILGIL